MEEEEGSKRKCCTCCTTLLLREGDSAEDTRIKRELTPLMLMLVPLNFVVVWYFVRDVDTNPFFVAAFGAFGAASLTFLSLGRLGRPPMLRVLTLSIMIALVGVLLHDLSTAANLWPRSWSFVVLLLDLALVFNIPGVIPCILTVTLIYLLFERVESGRRFGIYDAFHVQPVPPLCDCVNPPCLRNWVNVFSSYIPFVVVLMVDFYLTRGFATGLRRQLRRVEASVEVSGRVAGELARYDVDEAEKAIDEGNDLPPELAESYRQLLSNLRTYRAYLPAALLEVDTSIPSTSPREVAVPPPGKVGGGEVEVGMVFTDIQSSTQLWEQYPRGMYEGLRVHDQTLREAARDTGGYEVKVIGDALMLAFSSALNAVRFSLAAQQGLVDAQWPSELKAHPLCRPVIVSDGLVWSGVRVRIAINWGGVRAERNPVTGRYDYFGQTVNVAARVEGALRHGGLTGITQSTMDELDQEFRDQADVFITNFGDVELRGVSSKIRVYVVLPSSLSSRWQLLFSPTKSDGSPSVVSSMDTQPSKAAPVGPVPAFGLVPVHQISAMSIPSSGTSPLVRGSPATAVSPMLWGSAHSSKGSEPPRLNSHLFGSPQWYGGGHSNSPDSRFEFSRSSFPDDPTVRIASNPHVFESNSKLALGLETGVGTVVAVRGDLKSATETDALGIISEFLLQADAAAVRTKGTIITVMSGLLVVSWNTVHQCAGHIEQAGHFTVILKAGHVMMGAASGKVMHGNICGFRRRYVTVLGSSIELALALSDSAVLKGAKTLSTGDVAEYLDREGHAVPAEQWRNKYNETVFTVWSSERGDVVDGGEGRIAKVFAPSFPRF
eukprot:Hpha_TRINITY_DN16166_c2_g1::TRINITY_DN16166_c2_g1_i1::g.4374::m.4374